jgi:23S rRNA (guanosine2251-2'-O)-methyltransferase
MERITRINPLIEVLKSAPRRVNKIILQKEEGHRPLGTIVDLAKDAHIPYLFLPRTVMDKMAPHHQGVIATLAPKEFASLEDVLRDAGEKPLLVLLDEIEDPQNLGAILRSAECAGVDGVVLPERRSAGLTETVLEVSAGALEHLKVARVTNLVQTMERLKQKGIWIVGAESGGDGFFWEFDYTQPAAIVLGSEGKGIRPLVRKTCDRILSIPMRGKINSLNVAAAASIFLFEAARQRTMGVRS